MGILKQPTWWEDASEASPPAQWEAGAYPVTVDFAPPERGEFTGTIKFPLGTPILLSATSTPGTPGDPDFGDVVLLLHNDTSGFVDSSSYARTMTNYGSQVGFDTGIKKFGAGSANFNFGVATLWADGDGAGLDFSTGDWTIEMSVYFNSGHAGFTRPVIRKGVPGIGANEPFFIYVDGAGHIFASGIVFGGGTAYNIDGGDISAYYDTFATVELDRHGSTITLRINGVTVGTPATFAGTLIHDAGDHLQIGGREAVGVNLGGNIDEIRITNGVARYTTDYTPDVIAFYNQLPIPPVPGSVPGGFAEDTPYYVVPSGDVNPLTFALAATLGGVPIVATDAGVNVVATDGRYTFLSADTQISYSGDIQTPITLTLTGTVRLAYQTIVQAGTGTLQFEYNIGAGAVDIPLTNTTGAVGILSVCLDGATQFVWGLKSGSTGATVAFQEGPGDTTYGNGGVNFNCSCPDENDFQTLAQLRRRMMVRLGFASTADNPPPGMADLLTDFLQSAQRNLFKKYPARFTRRFFKWDMTQGTRFYGVKGNTDDTYRNLRADFTKGVEWSGIQDSKGTWTPIYEGIQPELYTMVTQLGRPVRYELRECIEVFPAPDGPYSLWLKAHIGLQAFTADGDETTIDSEVVFLHALAVAKAHYGQADANTVQAMALAYLGELTAGTHLNKRYIPGAHPQMPIVKPALIQFQDGS